jgi:hypothetical protein
MNAKILSGLFLLALLANGCISEFNAKLPSDDLQILIVEGSIIEDSVVNFYLSKSFPIDFTSIPEENLIINANLTIIGSDGYKSLPAINFGRGVYRLSVGKLDDNVEYGIQIEYEGNTYQSSLSKPIYTPEIDSLSCIQPEKNGIISLCVSTHDDTRGAKFFLWSYKEDWEIFADYSTTIFYNPLDGTFYDDDTAPYYYCWKSSSSNRLFIGSTESLKENKIINKNLYQASPESDRFSVLYCTTVYQRAISKGAFEYYQNKIVLNEDMAGLFTPHPSELNGNITCITDPSKKVMGYVEAIKNTTYKRLFISASQISRPGYFTACELISQEEVDEYLMQENLTYSFYYMMGFRPAGWADQSKYPQIVPEYWSSTSCTDCRAKSATKIKPDFWPNNHK